MRWMCESTLPVNMQQYRYTIGHLRLYYWQTHAPHPQKRLSSAACRHIIKEAGFPGCDYTVYIKIELRYEG